MSDLLAFDVEVLEYKEVHAVPGDWTLQDVQTLLDILEVDTGDASGEADLLDLLLMALGDVDEDEASDVVLEYVFGDTMSRGIRQNLVQDLEDDRPWEKFAQPDKQPGVFRAVTLLQQAFPKRFGVPDAARVRIQVTARNANGERQLRRAPKAAFVMRLLAAGMSDRAVLRRLYEEPLQKGAFAEADAMLWHFIRETGSDETPAIYEVHSSVQWLGPLEDADGYEATVPED